MLTAPNAEERHRTTLLKPDSGRGYLRQKGLLRYSRKAIQVYTDALGEYLQCRIASGAHWAQPGEDRTASGTA